MQSQMQMQTHNDESQSQDLYHDLDIRAEPESDEWSTQTTFDKVFYPDISEEDLMYKWYQNKHQLHLGHALL